MSQVLPLLNDVNSSSNDLDSIQSYYPALHVCEDISWYEQTFLPNIILNCYAVVLNRSVQKCETENGFLSSFKTIINSADDQIQQLSPKCLLLDFDWKRTAVFGTIRWGRGLHFKFYSPTGPCLITVKWPLARYMVLHNITRESVLRDNSDLFSGATIKLTCTHCTQGIFNGIYWAQPCSLPSGAIPRPNCLLYTPSSNQIKQMSLEFVELLYCQGDKPSLWPFL